MRKLYDSKQDIESRTSISEDNTINLTSKRKELYRTIKSELASLVRSIPKEIDSYNMLALDTNCSAATLSAGSRSLVNLNLSDITNISWHRQFTEEGTIISVQYWVDEDAEANVVIAFKHRAIYLCSNSLEKPTHRILQAHDSDIASMIIPRRADFLFSASIDGIIKKWSLKNKACVRDNSHSLKGSISIMTVSQESQLLATTGEDMILRFWSYDNLSLVFEWNSLYNTPITCLSFNQAGTLLATAANDPQIKILEMSSMSIFLTITDDEKVRGVEFDLENKMLLSFGDHIKLKFWNISTGKMQYMLNDIRERGNAAAAVSLAKFLPNQNVLVVRKDTSIASYTLKELFPEKLSRVQIFPQTMCIQNYLFTLHSSNMLFAWDIIEWVPVFSYSPVFEAPLDGTSKFSLELSRDGSKLLTTSANEFTLFEVQVSAFVKIKKSAKNIGYSTLSKDATSIFTVDRMALIKIWSTESAENKENFSLALPKDFIAGLYLQSYLLRLTSDNEILVVALEADLLLWNLKNKDVYRRLKALHTKGWITQLMVSSDDKYAISYGNNRVVIVDIQKREVVNSFESPETASIISMSLSAGNKYLITNTKDDKTGLWDFELGKLIYTIPWGDKIADINACVITEDREKIIASSQEGNIALFDTSLLNKTVHIQQAKNTASLYTNPMSKTKAQINVPTAVVYKNQLLYAQGNSILVVSLDSYLVVDQLDEVLTNGVIQHLAILGGKEDIIAANTKEIAVWSHPKRILQFRIVNKFKGICRISSTFDGQYIVIGLDSDKVALQSSSDSDIHYFDFSKNLTALTSSKTAAVSACATADLKIHIMKTVGNKKIKNSILCHWHEGELLDLMFSSKEKYIFIASKDKTISLLNTKQEQLVYKFEKAIQSHQHVEHIIAFPCSLFNNSAAAEKGLIMLENEILTLSKDGRIQIWNNMLNKRQEKCGAACSSLQDNYYLSLCPLLEFLDGSQQTENRKNLITTRSDLVLYPEYWNWNHISTLTTDIELFKATIENEISFQPDFYSRFPHEYLLADTHQTKEKKICLQWLLEKITEGSFKLASAAEGFESLTKTFFKYHRTLSDQELLNFLSLLSIEASKLEEEQYAKQGRLKLRNGFDFVKVDPKATSYARYQRRMVNESYKRSSYLIETTVIGLCLSFQIEHPETLNLLQIIADREMKELFEQKVVRVVVEYFWRVCLKYQILQAVMFAMYALVFSTYSVLRVQGINSEAETGMLAFTIAMAVAFIIIELLEFSGNMRAHVTILWNYVDVISAFLPLITSITILSMDSSEQNDTTVATLIAWSLFAMYLKLIAFFRLSARTRKFIRMVIEIVKAMRSFLFVVLFVIIGFTTLFFHNAGPENTFGNYLVTQYLFLFTANQSEYATTPSDFFFYSLLLLILSLIMKNMLITLMSDTYSRVDSSLTLVDTLEKISLIIEYATFKTEIKKLSSFCVKKRQGAPKKKILLVIEEYRQGTSSLASEAARLTIINKKFDKLVCVLIPDFYEKFREQIEQFELKLSQKSNELRAENQEIARNFSRLHALKQLTQLEKLKQLENFPRFDKLEKLDKLDKLEKIDKVDKIDKITNTNITAKLKKFDVLEKLDSLEKLDELSVLKRLDWLDELSDLDKLLKLNHLDQLSSLSKLDVLDEMKELYRLDLLHGLEKLDSLDSLDKLNNLSKLDKLSQIEKVSLLEGLVNQKEFKNLELLDKLKVVDVSEIVMILDSLDSKLEESLRYNALEEQQWNELGLKVNQIDKLAPITDSKIFSQANLGSIQKVETKIDTIIDILSSIKSDNLELELSESKPTMGKKALSKPKKAAKKAAPKRAKSKGEAPKVKEEEIKAKEEALKEALKEKEEEAKNERNEENDQKQKLKVDIQKTKQPLQEEITADSSPEDLLAFSLSVLQKVRELNLKDLFVMKSYITPPKPILNLMAVIANILQNKVIAADWANAKKVLSDNQFLQRIQTIDPSNISNEVVLSIENYLSENPISDLTQTSLICPPLHNWVRYVLLSKKIQAKRQPTQASNSQEEAGEKMDENKNQQTK